MISEFKVATDSVRLDKAKSEKSKEQAFRLYFLKIKAVVLEVLTDISGPRKCISIQRKQLIQSQYAQALIQQKEDPALDENDLIHESIIYLYNKGVMQRDIAVTVDRHKSNVSRHIKKARTEGRISE